MVRLKLDQVGRAIPIGSTRFPNQFGSNLDVVGRATPIARLGHEGLPDPITLVDSIESTANSTSVTVLRPGTATVTRLDFLSVAVIVLSGGNITTPYPDGWELVTNKTFNSTYSIWVFRRPHKGTAEPTNWIFTTDNGANVRNVSLTTYWDNASTDSVDVIGTIGTLTSTTTITAPGVQPTYNNGLALFVAGTTNISNAITAPSGWTKEVDNGDVGAASLISGHFLYKVLTDDSYIADVTTTMSQSSNNGAFLVIFKNADPTLEPVVPTLATPVWDIESRGWTNESSVVGSIYESVNNYEESTYAISPAEPDGPEDKIVLALSQIPRPVAEGKFVRYRLGKNDNTDPLSVYVSLYQGQTLIGQWSHNNISQSPSTYEHVLTAGEAAAITNGADLRLEIYAKNASGGWYGDFIRSAQNTMVGGSFNVGVNRNSSVMPLPGDLMLAFLNIQANITVIPSGWTAISEDVLDGLFVYSKVAAYDEPLSYVWTQDSNATTSSHALIVLKRGSLATFQLSSASSTGSGTTTFTAPSLTSTEDNELLFNIYRVGGNRTGTPDSGMTELAETNASPSLYIQYQVRPTPGATGTKNVVWSTSGVGGSISMLIQRNE